MEVALQYFDGCPNWETSLAHLVSLQGEGHRFDIVLQFIHTPEEAESAGFRGSPTLIVDGIDPFADPDAPVGLSCRIYTTETGHAGSPTLKQLREAITGSEQCHSSLS